MGKIQRDFTYIDDIVEGVLLGAARPPAPGEASRPSSAPCKLYHISSHQPVELMKVIEVLEKCLGKTARKKILLT